MSARGARAVGTAETTSTHGWEWGEGGMRGTIADAIRRRWQYLLGSFWFIPGLVALFGAALAVSLLQVDRRLDRGPGSVGGALIFAGSPSAARSILSTIASSFITVAGLTFSLTITTLQLAANQFTPRVLRTFLADRITQVVAGGFVGIFAYCLLVLATIRDASQAGTGFVPALSVTVSIDLGLLGLALLLLFIHHTAQSIQVSTITARVARQTLRAIERADPGESAPPAHDLSDDALVGAWRAEGEPGHVYPARPGYVRYIALDALDALDEGYSRPGLRIYLPVRPGDFVTPGAAIAEVWPRAAAGGGTERIVRRAVDLAEQRDIGQDAAFGVRQLADIALRALLPGINDPTTAITCIAYLQAVLERLAGRDLPPDVRRGTDGGASVVACRRTFDEYVEVFAEIGRAAGGDARVAGAVLDALAAIAARAAHHVAGGRLSTLVEMADRVAGPAIADARTEHDRLLLARRRAHVERAARP